MLQNGYRRRPAGPVSRTWRSLLIVMATVFIFGCEDSPRLHPLEPQDTILAFGDSLTYGTGGGAGNSYPDVLQRLSGVDVINAGIPGEISANGKRRLPALLEKHRPAILVLCHGGNDILRRLDRKQMQQNIEAMVEMAKQQNIEVVLIGVPDFSLFLSAADQYDAIAERYALPYLPDILPEILKQAALKSDQIHPNADGYALMAEAVYALLVERGAIRN